MSLVISSSIIREIVNYPGSATEIFIKLLKKFNLNYSFIESLRISYSTYTSKIVNKKLYH